MLLLLSNDDGPPSASSPFLLSFLSSLRTSLISKAKGEVKVRTIIPSTQCSWGGNGFTVSTPLSISYLYPPSIEPSLLRRTKEEWEEELVLVDGSPSSCVNLGLWNAEDIWGSEEKVDLVVTGPNFGRNTGTAFEGASATLGSALSANLCRVPSIAVSYGIFGRPIRPEYVAAANEIACKIIWRLWETGFPEHDRARCYSVNIPLVEAITKDPKVVWAKVDQQFYGRLFKREVKERTIDAEGDTEPLETKGKGDEEKGLKFEFRPDIDWLIHPPKEDLVEGTDTACMFKGEITVTCHRAAYTEVTMDGEREWKL
ncbi:sure-like protein [Atractiella rhizophila]|nr:sure-like protein [Atractiella rhizophila]